MTKPHFPDLIRQLPEFAGPFIEFWFQAVTD